MAASIDVTINALPNVNGGGDQSVCEGDSVTLNGSGATSYTWDNGVVNGAPFVQATGTTAYIVIGTDGNGCENSDTVDVSVVAYPDISVTNDGVNLTAEPGYSYQWVDCDSIYADIPGETNQSFTPTVSGNYAVVVDNSGCVDTSNCFLFPVSTIYVEGGSEDISIYPNPSSGKFYFEFGNPYFAEQIVIFDATGRLIYLVNVNNKTRVDIDISTNSAGVYFCKIEGNGSVQVHRLIIE
jgi:hypothetical protein